MPIERDEVEQLIADAVRAERERSQKAAHDLHCEILATIEATVAKALDTATDMSEAAVKELLALTKAALVEHFRECQELDRKARGLTVLHDQRRVN